MEVTQKQFRSFYFTSWYTHILPKFSTFSLLMSNGRLKKIQKLCFTLYFSFHVVIFGISDCLIKNNVSDDIFLWSFTFLRTYCLLSDLKQVLVTCWTVSSPSYSIIDITNIPQTNFESGLNTSGSTRILCCEKTWALYMNKEQRMANMGIACVFSVSAHAPLPHTKHKFEDKIIQNIKTAAEYLNIEHVCQV